MDVAGFLTRQNRTEALRCRATLELLHHVVNVALALVLIRSTSSIPLATTQVGRGLSGTDQIVQVIAQLRQHRHHFVELLSVDVLKLESAQRAE